MTEYNFTLHLKDNSSVVMAEEMQEQLGNAGCTDGTSCSRDGECKIVFTREASSLQEAIKSAINQVESCGLDVDTIITDSTPWRELTHA